MSAIAESPGLALRSVQGRGLVAATALASGMAFLDGSVVNVALPALGRSLGGGMAGLQWVVDAYLLTLSALLLLGGALGDRLGRRRVFFAGVLAFAATSALCGAAPTLTILCLARALQGIAAALLVPGSLAILKSGLRAEDQDAAVGAWAGLSGILTAAGPIAGGWLVQALSWRSIFFLNLPLSAAALVFGVRAIPADRAGRRAGLDWPGAALAALWLGALVYALIEGPGQGWPRPVELCGAASFALLAAFLLRERRTAAPMLPPGLFAHRQFTAANLVTFALYFALSGATFLLVLGLQSGLGYSPVGSSLVLLPIAILLLALSPAAGRLAHRVGYRLPLTAGPIVCAAGLALVGTEGLTSGALVAVLGGVVVFAAGLGLTVAPLTAAVMSGAPPRDAGIASAVNNAVARVAGLLGVAVLPGLWGISGAAAGEALLTPVRRGLLATAALCVLGGLAAWLAMPERESAPR